MPFVAIDALSITDPEAFDENVLRPVADRAVPLPDDRLRRLPHLPPQARQADTGRLVLAAGAFALMTWGLYRAIAGPVST